MRKIRRYLKVSLKENKEEHGGKLQEGSYNTVTQY